MLSQNVRNITPSLTRILFSKAAEYDSVIDLTLGDPDFPPPHEVQDEACGAIRSNLAHYSPNEGILKARELAAENIRKVYGLHDVSARNIILTTGGMGALFLSLFCIINPGDEVIIFSPYYINYLQMIQMCGGVPVIVKSFSAEKGMFIDVAEIERRITPRTRAMVINSPNNPTGCMIPPSELDKAADIASKHGLYVISDEVYRSLIFDGEHSSIIQHTRNPENVIIVDSLSKEYSMTGYRIGYAFADESIIRTMSAVQENVAACAPTISQYAMARAYEGADNSYISREFRKRRDVMCRGLEGVRGLSFMIPPATFYLFLNIQGLGMNAEEFSYTLLEREHVAVVPGNAYGDDYSGHVRIAFTKDIPILEEACTRIKRFSESLL